MRVITFYHVPPFDNATYIVVDERGGALVVDPSMGERVLLDAVREAGLRVVEILNTHGHADHVWANAPVKEATGARLAIHRADEHRLALASNGGIAGLPPAPLATADDLIEEGPLRYIEDLELVALHTPGHTEGSTCFHFPAERVLFSGDVLFAGTIGRVDLPGGDPKAMERSLARVAALPPETTVFPGHGTATSIGAELSWLKDFRFG